MQELNPVIVVVGYNRPHAISRLLNSLSKVVYKSSVTLVISIDNSGCDDVVNVADSFDWGFGEKVIIHHQERLGLRRHIIACGDLTEKYGAVIVFEDDLDVSPYFYEYVTKALAYYEDESSIAGVSLYNHCTGPLVSLPFTPLLDGTDVYFLKFASSWGQVWSRTQWLGFKAWYENHAPIDGIPGLPYKVINWPETSWLKYFIAYMNIEDKYFVYPRLSLTTNYCDAGEHHIGGLSKDIFQVPMLVTDREYTFCHLSESHAIYDSHFEWCAEQATLLCHDLASYDFVLDLYGDKQEKDLIADYVVTSKKSKKSVKQYSGSLKPNEVNLIRAADGDVFTLCKAEDVIYSGLTVFDRVRLFSHNYPLPDLATLIGFVCIKTVVKLKKLFGR